MYLWNLVDHCHARWTSLGKLWINPVTQTGFFFVVVVIKMLHCAFHLYLFIFFTFSSLFRPCHTSQWKSKRLTVERTQSLRKCLVVYVLSLLSEAKRGKQKGKSFVNFTILCFILWGSSSWLFLKLFRLCTRYIWVSFNFFHLVLPHCVWGLDLRSPPPPPHTHPALLTIHSLFISNRPFPIHLVYRSYGALASKTLEMWNIRIHQCPSSASFFSSSACPSPLRLCGVGMVENWILLRKLGCKKDFHLVWD